MWPSHHQNDNSVVFINLLENLMVKVNVLFSRENLKMFWSIPAINHQNSKLLSLHILCLQIHMSV